MSQEIIREALALAHQGQLSQARAMLMDMLRQDPDNLSGWGNLYRLCYNDKERKVCVENILRLRPQDDWATRKLHEIEGAESGPAVGVDTEPGRPASPVDEEEPVHEDEVPTAVTRKRQAEAEEAEAEATDEEPTVSDDDTPTAVTRQHQVEKVTTEKFKTEPLPLPPEKTQSVSEEKTAPEVDAQEGIDTAVTRQREDALNARVEGSDTPEEQIETAVTRRAAAAEEEPAPEVEPEPESEPEDDELETQEVPTGPSRSGAEDAADDLEGMRLPDLVTGGVLTVKAAAFLKAAVLGRISILVSAEDGADAQAMLQTLADIIPPDAPERLIQADLTVDNVMMFAAAMLAGGGAMGALEAPSVTNALASLEVLMERAHPEDVQRHREIIVGGLEVLVHLARLDDDRPAVTAIYEVIGLRDDEVRIEPVFVYGLGSGLLPTGNRPAVMNTIEQMGLALPREVFLAS